MLLVKHSTTSGQRSWSIADIIFLIGCAALVLPVMIEVARFSWSTEQGGHGPIVLATGLWLLWREVKSTTAPRTRPARPVLAWLALTGFLLAFIVARITGILELEAMMMYPALIIAIYLLFGGALLRAIWFPLLYLAFTLPPPDTVVAVVTQPIKIAISSSAVSLLHALGYPIASAGVTIQIAQYELLVAAACAGLNSIVSLAAICLFYVYLRHRNDVRSFVVVVMAIIPVAIFSNFVRVLVLILVTYYFGEAAAQGFIHDFAGLLMFAVALFTIFAVDSVHSRLRFRRRAPDAIPA